MIHLLGQSCDKLFGCRTLSLDLFLGMFFFFLCVLPSFSFEGLPSPPLPTAHPYHTWTGLMPPRHQIMMRTEALAVSGFYFWWPSASDMTEKGYLFSLEFHTCPTSDQSIIIWWGASDTAFQNSGSVGEGGLLPDTTAESDLLHVSLQFNRNITLLHLPRQEVKAVIPDVFSHHTSSSSPFSSDWERAHFILVMPQMMHRSENSEPRTVTSYADEASMLKGLRSESHNCTSQTFTTGYFQAKVSSKVGPKLQTGRRNFLWSRFCRLKMLFDRVVL